MQEHGNQHIDIPFPRCCLRRPVRGWRVDVLKMEKVDWIKGQIPTCYRAYIGISHDGVRLGLRYILANPLIVKTGGDVLPWQFFQTKNISIENTGRWWVLRLEDSKIPGFLGEKKTLPALIHQPGKTKKNGGIVLLWNLSLLIIIVSLSFLSKSPPNAFEKKSPGISPYNKQIMRPTSLAAREGSSLNLGCGSGCLRGGATQMQRCPLKHHQKQVDYRILFIF